MKQRIITLIALLCALAGTAGATTKTYTVSGGQGGSPTEFYAQFSDGSTSTSQVGWTYNSTAEISFSLPGGLTLKLSNTDKRLSVSNNNTIGGQGATTLTVSSSTYYIYHVRLLTADGNVIQLDANGNAVTQGGVSECDYWNMTKSFSHIFSNGILFSKIEVSYATAIPITDAVITGLSSQYSVSNTAIMPTPTVTWHGTTLTLGTHCTISYLNNTAAGTATVKATGKGIFSSSTSVSANYTLVWATYSVRFNKNNDAATGTMSNQNFTYNTAQPLSANGFTTPTGYTFAAWNTAADGSGTSYSDQQEVSNLTATNGGTVDLYAQWTANQYTVTLDNQSATTAGTASVTATYDAALPSITPPTRTYYTFGGYYTEANGGGTQYYHADGTSASAWHIAEPTTLYAQWTPTAFTITYDLAGGSVATANPASYNIESPAITLVNPTRTGYTFAGWTGTGLNEPTMEVTIPTGSTENRTYTATWIDVWGIAGDADGSQEHPYVITTTAGLDLLAKNVNGTDGYTANDFNGKYFVLDSDISYTHTTDWNNAASTENNYTAIGGRFNGSDIPFCGTFDGQGHTVSGIRIYKGGATGADSYQGLFGITEDATIRNVILADARITGYQFVGGIAGFITYNNNSITLENCRVRNDVTIHAVANNAYNHGGVVGACNGGTISGCVSSATLTVAGGLNGIDSYGGIVGYLSGNLSDCLAVGVAIPDVTRSGAIAGDIGSRVLSNNFYSGCTLGGTPTASGIGVGRDSYNSVRHDVTANNGAVPYTTLHTLTLGENITATGALLNQGGTISVPAGSTVTLSYSGLVDGQIVVFTLNDNELSGNSFTMPAADATVSASAFTAWGTDKGADGSAEHPYVITRAQELNLLAERVNSGNDFSGKYFVLDADIAYNHTTDWNNANSTENNYTPIGGVFDINTYWFRGTFDGQGHTVSGIRIYKGGVTEADRYQGLFGITQGATIRNVILADARITGYQFVGGITGDIGKYDDNGSIVENCCVGNDVTIHAVANSASYHGGVVGYCHASTIISGCVSSATLTVADRLNDINYYGGIVGSGGSSSNCFANCLAVGVAIPDVTCSGAIAGFTDSRVLSNNYYSDCTLGGIPAVRGIGVGFDSYNSVRHDVTANNGAVPATLHTLTLGENITAAGALLNQGGTIRVPAGSTVTLSYSGGEVAGQIVVFLLNGSELSGNTFTMPAADATVSTSVTDFWGIADGANGSEDHPYVITTTAGLDLLAQHVNGGNSYNGKYFKLGADIAYDPTALDANGENYTAIGGFHNGYKYFRGSFDGDGHTVSGIRIKKTGSTNADRSQGLFGYVDGTVQNVILDDANITGRNQVGGITGDMSSATIKNCLVLNTAITATYNEATNAGVITGWCSGTLTANYYHNCTFTRGGTTSTTNIGSGEYSVSDRDGARSVHALTLPAGVTATGESVVIDGTTYYASNTIVTLSCTQPGYDISDVTVNDTPLDGNTFTMPAADATVTATLTSIILYEIAYLDEDGNAQTTPEDVPVFLFTGTETTLGASGETTWYLVNSNITIEDDTNVELAGNVNFILADGSSFNGSFYYYLTSNFASYSLTIYAQSTGDNMGSFNSFWESVYGISALNIHGGNISLWNGGSSLPLFDDYPVSITGGRVSLSSEQACFGEYCTVTLGCTAPTDYIYIGGVYAYPTLNVSIKEGQILSDGSHLYSGTLTKRISYDDNEAETEVYRLRGEMVLRLYTGSLLADNDSEKPAGSKNEDIISTLDDGATHTLALQGRIFYKDNQWNTLCLPFDVSSLNGTPLDGATLMELDDSEDGSTGYDASTGTLSLYFKEATSIEAGKPYLMKWSSVDGEFFYNPVFNNVTIDNSAAAQARKTVTSNDGKVSFCSTYDAMSFTTSNKSILFLGGENTLYYPQSGARIGACRAYFQLNDPNAQVKAFVLNFGDEERPTGLTPNPSPVGEGSAGAWYTIDGRRINGKPAKKGLYVNNGRKVVIK